MAREFSVQFKDPRESLAFIISRLSIVNNSLDRKFDFMPMSDVGI